MSHRIFFLAAFLAVTLLFAACRSSEILGPDPGEISSVKTTITGTVVDELGKPVEGAAVSAHGVATKTDKFGFFVLENVSAPKDRCVAIAKHDGYFADAKAQEPQQDGHTQFRLFMMSHGARKSVVSTTGGSISVASTSGDASIAFEKDGFVTSSGAPFTGKAEIAVRYLDPSDPTFAYFFAGDQAGNRQNGDRTSILSNGVLRVDIRSTGGEQLRPAPGKPALVSYPIPSSMRSTAPSVTPLWSFDETIGIWVEAGTATREGNNYIGAVTHFSDWTCGAPLGQAIVTGTVTCGGSPVMGVWVRVGQSYALTNDQGKYRKHVPAGAELDAAIDANVNHGMFYSDPLTILALSELETGTYDIPLRSSCHSTIKGRLTDNQDRAIPGRLAYATTLGDVIVSASFDGLFQMHLPENTSVTLEGMSWVCGNTKLFEVTSGAEGETVDIGDLKLCGADEPVTGDIDVSTFGGKVVASLSPDGSMMAIMGRDPMIVIRDANSGAFIRNLNVDVRESQRPQFSADGSHLLVENPENGWSPFSVVEATTGNVIRTFEKVRTAFIMPDGKSVIGVRYDVLAETSELLQLSVETGEVLKTYTLDDAQVGEFAIMGITPDWKRAVITTVTSMIVFDLINDVIETQAPYGSSGGMETLSERSIAADGSRLAIATWASGIYTVNVIETATGKILYSLDGGELSAYDGMILHPNGQWLLLQKRAVDGVQTPPVFIDVSSGEVVRELTTEGTPGIFYRYSFSIDGSRLIGVYWNSDLTRMKIRTWDL